MKAHIRLPSPSGEICSEATSHVQDLPVPTRQLPSYRRARAAFPSPFWDTEQATKFDASISGRRTLFKIYSSVNNKAFGSVLHTMYMFLPIASGTVPSNH